VTQPNQLATLLAEDEALGAVLAEVRARSSGDPGHDLHHALRVALWTLRLVGGRVNPRLAVAAALLHDVVNVPKSSPERSRASEQSAKVAQRLLAEHGFSHDDCVLVGEAIVDHSFSRGATPRSVLGRALQDADRLEALGALGLMRCISTGASMGADYFDPNDPWAEHRELDDRRHSVDHFFTKLLRLPFSMQTDAGKREAERRAAFLRQFLEQLASELDVAAPKKR